MCLSLFQKIFTKKSNLLEGQYALPSVPNIGSLQEASDFIKCLQKYAPKDIKGVLGSELMILDVVKSPSLIEGHFDSLVHQFECSLKQSNQSEQIKEQFVCMIASMFYQLDAQHEIDLLEYDEKAFEQRKALIIDTHKYLSDNITNAIALTADTIKSALLATIETAKAAGKTAMVVVDEFGHDAELIFDGGITNISMKDFSVTTKQSGEVVIATTTDESAKQEISEKARIREDIINANRGKIQYNADAYIDTWAKTMQNIVVDAAIFDTQKIAEKRFLNIEKQGELIGRAIDAIQTQQKQRKIQEDFIKTLYRLFYKLEKHSVDIGKSNYLSDVIDRYVDIQQENLKQYVKYVSNIYDEHISGPIEKPKDYDSLIGKILSSESLVSIFNILTFFPLPPIVRLPIMGYSTIKTIMGK